MLHNLLVVFEVIVSIVLIVSVLLQPSKAQGLTGFAPTSSETFFSKNKSRTYESLMARITVVSSILFAVIILLFQLPKFK